MRVRLQNLSRRFLERRAMTMTVMFASFPLRLQLRVRIEVRFLHSSVHWVR